MADLLLELFSEEIPARMQADAIRHLHDTLVGQLAKGGISVAAGDAQSFVTPRRLAVWIKNLPVSQAASETEMKGPKLGAPDAAMQGFLKKCGMSREQLIERDGVYIAVVKKAGQQTADVLKSAIEEILKSFPWPKSMRWGMNETSWVRPLHSIVCLFDGKVVPVEFAGVKAGNSTKGHRFLSTGAITISNPSQYEAALEKAHVIANRDKRKASILKQAQDAAAAKKLQLKKDEGLLEEVTGLVEWPTILTGTIDAKFMDLPKEVLISEMRAHQKYFALEKADGSLSDTFLITSNMMTDDKGKAIIAGNERVLRARLSDGRFFWDQDRKKPLSDWAKGLESVTYHEKLGSIADKVKRIEYLAVILSEALAQSKDLDPSATLGMTKRAAQLCKADLVTGMVGEFPELQGVMGRYYAVAQKEPQDVADAIRDHYLPLGPSSPVPNKPVSVCVALADKLDTLVSMFAIGEKPTGSKDPFALRRSALGVIRILLENNVRLSLAALFKNIPFKEIALHKAQEKLVRQTEARLHEPHKVGKYLTVNESACSDIPEDAAGNLVNSLLAFFHDRLKVQLKDQGIRHDVISAVTADGDDDLVRVVERAKALQDFLGTDDGKNLLAAYKRAANILSIEEKKDKTTYKANELQVSVLTQEEETALAGQLKTKAPQIDLLRKEEKFVEAMRLLATLRAPIDHFFDKVMVNSDNASLRVERLRLLASIREAMDGIAQFAAIEG